MPAEKKGLDRNQLKYLVIFTMVLDHMAWGFVDARIPVLGQVMHFFGRLTGPMMAYFLAEGYHHTHDVRKYQKRLGIFALVSWLPFVFFEAGLETIAKNPMALITQGVIFTLFLGITALRVWDSEKLSKPQKVTLVVLLTLLSLIGDWPIMDVLGPLFLHVYRNDRRKRWLAMVLLYAPLNLCIMFMSGNGQPWYYGWYNLGVGLVPLLVIFCYNGRGGKKSAFNKWFFYVFYPAHFVVLGVLKWYVFGGV